MVQNIHLKSNPIHGDPVLILLCVDLFTTFSPWARSSSVSDNEPSASHQIVPNLCFSWVLHIGMGYHPLDGVYYNSCPFDLKILTIASSCKITFKSNPAHLSQRPVTLSHIHWGRWQTITTFTGFFLAGQSPLGGKSLKCSFFHHLIQRVCRYSTFPWSTYFQKPETI